MLDLWTLYVGIGPGLILIGLLWLRRAYVGEKAGAIITLTQPDERLMSNRERRFALFTGILNVIVGILYVWVGLRRVR